MSTSAPDTVVVESAGGRELGFDLARSVAIVLMVLVNFQLMLGAGPGPNEGAADGLLRWLVHVPSGRSSSLFVTLAGVGITLLTRPARFAIPADRLRARVMVVRVLLLRSAFLVIAGVALWHVWSIDILHFYAWYLLIAALLLWWLPTWALLATYVVIVASGAAAQLAGPAAVPELPFRTPLGFLLDGLLTGVHPVVPWLAFVVLGIVLGRLDLRVRARRRRLMWTAALVVLVTELSSFALGSAILRLEPLTALRPHIDLLATGWTPDPLYVVSASGTATLVITLAHEALAHPRLASHPVTRALIATGQMALTIYVTHAVFGVVVPRALFGLHRGVPVAWVTAYWAGFCVVVILGAALWRRFLARGPLEWVMRMVTSWRLRSERTLMVTRPVVVASSEATGWPARLGVLATLAAVLLAVRIVGVPGTSDVLEGLEPRAGQLTLIHQRVSHSVVLAERRSVSFTTRSGLDLYLELDQLTGDGGVVRLAEDDDGGEGTEARILRELSPGRYRVTVRPYGAVTGPYRLEIHAGPPL